MTNLNISYERLSEIISEAIAKVTDKGDELYISDRERLLAHVTVKCEKYIRPFMCDVWASIGKDRYVTIHWKEVGRPRSMTASEWLKPVKGSDKYYSSMANWDELDWAISCLGIKKVKVKSYKVDEFGEEKEFYCSFYDLSPILS